MQAAMADGATSTANRRVIQLEKARRNGSLPTEGGYPRSELLAANAATTDAGGGSHGVPMDRSIRPPSNDAASGLNESRRS